MGEIKSAIELAMERTKGLVMDDREKEEAAAREMAIRVGALFRRFMEEMIDGDGFRKEYEKLEGTKKQKSDIAIGLALDEFDLSDKNDKVFEILSILGGDVDDRLRKESGALQREFHERMQAEVEDVTGSIAARLEKMGISGSGVEPNITEWDEWKSAVDRTKSLFRKRLAQWRTEARALQP